MKPHQKYIVESAFIMAPLLMLIHDVGVFLLDAEYFWVMSLPFWLSFFMYILVIYGLIYMAGAGRAAVASGLMALAGALIGVTIIGMSRIGWAMKENGIGEDMIGTVMSEPIVFLTSRAPGLMFPLGLILLFVIIKRKNKMSLLPFLLLLTGTLLFPVGRIPSEIVFNIVGDILQLLGFASVLKRL